MDLQFLRPLYEDFDGYVSVYLDTSLDAEDAAQATDLRWSPVPRWWSAAPRWWSQAPR
jgi:hypothetical protein